VHPVALAQAAPLLSTQLPPQQGSEGEHCCPTKAHCAMSVLDVAASVGVPPSVLGGGGWNGLPHTPDVWPAWITHTLPEPEQQSEVAVHLPPVGTQVAAPQMNLPVASGTHGLPLQQSAAVEQVPPAATQAEMV
jgi:hypothetical protein